jgi:hypothetical protein
MGLGHVPGRGRTPTQNERKNRDKKGIDKKKE